MQWKALLFPTHNRTFYGQHSARMFFRALHLWTVAISVGAYLYEVPYESWYWFHQLCIVSGFALMGLEIWTNGSYLVQIRCHLIVIKVAFLSFLHPWYPAPLWFLGAIFLASVFISHAPGNVRHYSLWHRKRMDFLS